MDPYSRNLIRTDFFAAKREIPCSVVVVLDGYLENRGLSLIQPISRAYPKGSIIELIGTDEAGVAPGGSVQAIAYIAFLELRKGGVIIVGDEVIWKKKVIGRIAGYDETHMPNHQNVILSVRKRISGKELRLSVEDRIVIRSPKKRNTKDART